jgi:hypothetical protein
MKPGSNYKMPKRIKRRLAVIVDAHYRGQLRRLMIQADLASRIAAPRTRDKDRADPAV